MIQFDTAQTRSLAKPTETRKSSIMLGGGGGGGGGGRLLSTLVDDKRPLNNR